MAVVTDLVPGAVVAGPLLPEPVEVIVVVHQSMVLFGAGRGEALKRFLVEEGVGRSGQF